MTPQNKDGPFRGTVIGVYPGKHGPYAVAEVEQPGIESVTFALYPPVWNEDDEPKPGIIVVLDDFRKKRRGWRAEKARFLRPSDEQSEE